MTINSITLQVNNENTSRNKIYFVYIVECNIPGYYVGITHNIQRRLEQHRTLKGSSLFVKEHGGALRLVFSELVLTKAAARKRESDLTKSLILVHGPGMVAGASFINLPDRERYEQGNVRMSDCRATPGETTRASIRQSAGGMVEIW